MKVTELFDRPMQFTDFKRDGDFIYNFFEVKGKEYIVIFHQDTEQFTRMNLMHNRTSFDLDYSSPGFGFAFGMLKEGVPFTSIMDMFNNQGAFDTTTNTGDSFVVFSTIGHIVMKFFNEFKPSYFYFAAQETNRYSLYGLLSKKLVKMFPDYDYEEDNHVYMIKKKSLQENKLKELRDTVLPYTKVDDETYTFKIEDLPEYKVSLIPFNNSTVDFILKDDYYIKMQSIKPVKGISFSFTQGEKFTITNTGYAPQIFSTVGDILKKYITTEKPDFFFFEATENEPSRVKAYSFLSKVIKREYPFYTLVELYSNIREENMFLFYDEEVIRLKDVY